jgi:HK97 family phage portal protein
MFNWLRKAVSVVATRLPSWDTPTYVSNNFEDYVTHGMAKNEVIYACIQAWSATASAVACKVYARGTDEEIEETEQNDLVKLLRNPNPEMTESDFLSLTITYLKLAGAAFWEKQIDNAGRVIALWPMRPDKVKIKAAQTGGVEAYIFTTPEGEDKAIPAERVLSFWFHDPRNIYKAISPLSVAARSGDVDNNTTDFIKVFWERGASPLGTLNFKGKVRDDQVAAIRRRWAERYGGFNKWFEPAVLDEDVQYNRIGLTMAEMDFTSLDARDEARICMALRVPPVLVGTLLGITRSTYSNYEQARLAWSQDDVLPLYKFIGQRLSKLAEDFGQDVYVWCDTSELPAFQTNEDAKFNRAVTGWNDGMLTLNEARETAGYEVLPDAEGDLFKRSFGDQMTNALGEPVIEPEEPPAATGDLIPRDTEATEEEVAAAKAYLKVRYGIAPQPLNSNGAARPVVPVLPEEPVHA